MGKDMGVWGIKEPGLKEWKVYVSEEWDKGLDKYDGTTKQWES